MRYLLTYCLIGAIDRRRGREDYAILDRCLGTRILSDYGNARIVQDGWTYHDGMRYDLLAWTVMPTHVHVIVEPYEGVLVKSLIMSRQTASENRINRRQGTAGSIWRRSFWQEKIKDDDQLERCIKYVLDSPKRVGLVYSAEDWEWSGYSSDVWDGGKEEDVLRKRSLMVNVR